MEQKVKNNNNPSIKEGRNQGRSTFVITEDYDEVVKVTTSPDINPLTFKRRVRCLMISGMTRVEAERYAITRPMQLSLFYNIGRGAFAVDSEAVGETPLYNPYTGEEIPEETEVEEYAEVSFMLPNGETIELFSEMRTANCDFGDFDETVESLVAAYRETTDRKTKESLEQRIEAQCDAFTDILEIQYEEIQGIQFSDLSLSIKQALLGDRV